MNRLTESASLYLKQHADNPVDWHPWDEAALQLAKQSGRPILLSIGYSACHWCHVMAHESFEDQATAAVMNGLFVNIKVDREERPDLDKVYQLAHQLLTGRGGGWPLTVFLDPEDLTPFFAGTYFPPEPRHGMPAFSDLLSKLSAWFNGNRAAVGEQSRRLREAIDGLQASGTERHDLDREVFATAADHLERRYDTVHGGFGGAPKFPQAPLLNLLQALSSMPDDYSSTAGRMLGDTLAKMALGGLRDHLDGGFFRYTVDGDWTIPHFEKMLYDNALLLPLYAETAASTGDSLLAETAEGIAGWLLSEMCADDGGFYASMDADADGVEGGFHVWDRQELKALLDESAYRAVADRFGLSGPPNFEGRYWHLVRSGPAGTMSDRKLLDSACRRMHAARSKRVPPATDTKRLTSWNALCAEGLCRAGVALQRPDWIDAAERNIVFLRDRLWKDGMLFAVHADDKYLYPAYLDDHAFLLKAILSLLQTRWKGEYLEFAREIADGLTGRFMAPDGGGFFFSAVEQESPIARLRVMQDDATPSGNGIAVQALELLGHLLAEKKYLEAAARTLRASFDEQLQHPLAHATLLTALRDHLEPPVQAVITGADPEELLAWKALTTGHDRVSCYVLSPARGVPAGIPGLYPAGERTMAYLCKGQRCLSPATSKRQFLEQLNDA